MLAQLWNLPPPMFWLLNINTNKPHVVFDSVTGHLAAKCFNNQPVEGPEV